MRRGLGRLGLLAGMILMGVGGWLWRVVPSSEACMALPMLDGLSGHQVVGWDATTRVPSVPHSFRLMGWQKGWLLLTPSAGGAVYRVRPTSSTPRLWLRGDYSTNTLLTWNKDALYLLSVDRLQSKGAIYRGDRQGRHLTRLAELEGNINVVATHPNGQGFIIEIGYYTTNDLVYLDTARVTVTRLTTTPDADETFITWGPDGRSILYHYQHGFAETAYYVVDVDTRTRQPIAFSLTNFYPWGYNPRHSLFLNLERTPILYRFDWQTLETAALLEFPDGLVQTVLMETDVLWLSETSLQVMGGLVLKRLDLITGLVETLPIGVERPLAWLNDKRRLIFLTRPLSSTTPAQIQALDVDTRTVTALVTLPRHSVPETTSVSPCGDAYLVFDSAENATRWGRFDETHTTLHPHYQPSRIWLRLEGRRWHPMALIGGGALLIGLGGWLSDEDSSGTGV